MTEETVKYTRWFLNFFENVIILEGWNLFIDNDSIDNNELIVGPIEMSNIIREKSMSDTFDNVYKVSKLKKEEVHKLAEEYGWLINDDGYVTGFNKENIKRNVHLIEIKDLGLI